MQTWDVLSKITKNFKGFPDRPVVKTLPSNAEGVGSILGQGAKIPRGQKTKT